MSTSSSVIARGVPEGATRSAVVAEPGREDRTAPAKTESRPNGHHPQRLRSVLSWAAALAVAVAATLAGRAALAPKPTPMRYETANVDHGAIAAKVTATGALSALVTVSVGSQVSGRVDALFADYGSHVKKGQVVARIEPSLFRAAVAQARANRAAAGATLARAFAQRTNAEKQYQRAAALNAEGLTSAADLDTSQAALGVARADVLSAESVILQSKAALDQSELNLRYTTIVSPIDGVVISRNVDVGQTVAATFQAPTLFSIAQDLTRMQVDTNVAEADVGRIRPKMDVTFRVDAYPTREFSGTVRQIRDNALTIQNVVTYDAVIDVDNSELLLKPGMTANVTVVYARKADAIRLPNGALRFHPDRAMLTAMRAPAAPTPSKPDERVVWLVRGGQPAAEIVRIGITDGVSTEVVEGRVHPGDAAIVEAADPSKRGP